MWEGGGRETALPDSAGCDHGEVLAADAPWGRVRPRTHPSYGMDPALKYTPSAVALSLSRGLNHATTSALAVPLGREIV